MARDNPQRPKTLDSIEPTRKYVSHLLIGPFPGFRVEGYRLWTTLLKREDPKLLCIPSPLLALPRPPP
eukprot:9495713-Pyramimonas_sp.AAC.1